MKMMNKIKDNLIQLVETLILIILSIVPLLIDIKGMFEAYLGENNLTPENFIPYLSINSGNGFIVIGIFAIVLIGIRKYNKEIIMNRINVYHDYSYLWYYYCAKILGIKKCNLVLVPINMQFKLVIQNVFNEFPMDETAYPVQENEIEIQISKSNWLPNKKEINLILEDTYPIDSKQIASNKRNLPMLKISRNDGENFGRHFSQKYIDAIINEVRGLDGGLRINIYATTNPMNTYNIVKRVFTNADRGNIAVLYVFQQESSKNRVFKEKGKKIY